MASHRRGFAHLSSRGKHMLKPQARYLTWEAQMNPYDSDTNPEGYFIFALAENRLSAPLVSEKIEQCRGHHHSTLSYDMWAGNQQFRQAVANLFSKYIFKAQANPDNFVAMAGAGAIMDALATALCEQGDHILLCTPAYRGFERDITTRSCCKLALAHSSADDGFRVSVNLLDQGLKQAKERGQTVKCVLLCTPVNPTGQLLKARELVDIVTWCRQNSLQCIVDEIYALSTFDSNATFVSVYQALMEANMSLGDDVHVVWSFSKDFCQNGYRVGLCYTESTALLNALQMAACFGCCSTDTQAALTKMLSDDAWLESYIEENKRRLRAAYDTTAAFWKSIGVNYIKSSSGFFVWINLGPFMEKEGVQGWEGEQHIADILRDECRVILTPGQESFCKEPGWFRCCFAALTDEEREIAWPRVKKRFC